MKLVALLLALSLTASAQTTFTDPANLRGERVSPSDGHELPIDQGASGLQQLLRKLNTRASLLLITAHPDDEDGGMLTLTSRGLGARVATLTLNRGEGGQNFVTPDFEDALGLIRTQELLSADRYFDASQFFGTEVDFGFSKTKEESFQKWGHERVLYDAVRAIRLYRPLVIAAVFVGGVTDGHGQHQVSGEIAQEAFKAAADPTVFPDMIKEGILPWQALKVYAHVPFADVNSKGVFDYATDQYVPARFTNYVTGKVTTTKPTADLIVPEGTTDPLLTDPATNQPRSYVQFARIGLGLQRTQISKNMRLPSAGKYDSAYHLYGSVLCNAPADARTPSTTPQNCHPEQAQRAEGPATKPGLPQPSETFLPKGLTSQPNFFTGIDTSIEGIADLAPGAFPPGQLSQVARAITTATEHFDSSHPSAIAPDLASVLTKLDQLIQSVEAWDGNPTQKANALHELRIKRVQLNDALVLAFGIHLDATAPSVQGDITASTAPPIHVTLSVDSPAQLHYSHTVILDDQSRSASRPARSRVIADYRSQPFPASGPLVKEIPLDHIGTEDITRPYFFRDSIEQPTYQLTDPSLRNAPSSPPALTAVAYIDFTGLGPHIGVSLLLERIVHNGPQPISIVPPVSIASAPTATVLPNGQTTAQLTATLRTDATTSANINVQSPHNWSIEAKAIPASAPTSIPDTTHSIHFFLHPTAPTTGPQLFHVTAQTPDHHTYSEGYRPVGYPGLIYTNFYTPATTRVVPVDLKLPEHLRIAYLPGTGDAVPEALATIGLNPTLITVADFTPTKLANFDTVILGVRAYTAHPDLHGAPTQTLLNWASSGGNVVVQYETSGLTSADTPYPLSLGDAEKVVDETDPVQLLEPSPATNRYPEASASGLIGAGNEGVLTPRYALLNIPNKITPADFDNWTEERGHGFLDTWDPHYTALTNVHDPGGPETAPQLPQRGGLITASVGKGRWTYCAFALYRQLPEAVPGAFRLFVNLLTPSH
jgi:LmbE family N-acetylglucosaminyl deacetylase